MYVFVIFQVSILPKKNRSLGSLQYIKDFAVLSPSPSQILKFDFHTEIFLGIFAFNVVFRILVTVKLELFNLGQKLNIS